MWCGRTPRYSTTSSPPPLPEQRRCLEGRHLEPRGGKLAQPALECPGINALKGEIAAGRLRGQKAQEALTKEAGRCRAKWSAEGVDLDGYTTAATADDIDALRQVLGHKTLNLQGLSYGTRLMLTVARRHPGTVRSLILDSVLPPEVNFDEVAATNFQPPDWGRQLLESMPHARYVEMRGQSHGASFNRCGGEITLAFLRAPEAPCPWTA